MKTYCCGVDYQHEPHENIEWFSTIDELKQKKFCWKQCGIIEITLDFRGEEVGLQWVVQQSL